MDADADATKATKYFKKIINDYLEALGCVASL